MYFITSIASNSTRCVGYVSTLEEAKDIVENNRYDLYEAGYYPGGALLAFLNGELKRGIEIPNGKAYRKVFETWDICDYHWYKPKSEAIKDFETKRFKYGPDTLEEVINDWKKYYYRK